MCADEWKKWKQVNENGGGWSGGWGRGKSRVKNIFLNIFPFLQTTRQNSNKMAMIKNISLRKRLVNKRNFEDGGMLGKEG